MRNHNEHIISSVKLNHLTDGLLNKSDITRGTTIGESAVVRLVVGVLGMDCLEKLTGANRALLERGV